VVGRPDSIQRTGSGLCPAACALGVAFLVLAGSLSPFAFDLAAARANGGSGVAAIGWPRSGFDDLLTNVGVYLPVGAALFLWLRRNAPAGLALTLTVAVGGAVSLLAEVLQTCIPVRTASWIDVIANVLGTLAGAALAPAVSAAARYLIRRISIGLARRPMSTAAGILATGLLVMGLRPFDFTTTTPALHASLAGSHWSVADAILGDAGHTGRAAGDLSTIGTAGVFVVLGICMALAARESRRSRRRASAAGIMHVTLIAVLIETVQIFVASRSFDVGQVLLNACAGALGAYLAINAIDAPSRSAWRGQPGLLLHPLLLWTALLLQVGYCLASAAVPFQDLAWQDGGSAVMWVPFSGYYGDSLTSVASHLLSVGVAFSLLALTAALLVRRVGARARWWVTAGVVLTVALCCELIQSAHAVRIADLTDPLLALTAAMLTALAYRRVRTAYAAATA